MITVDGTRRLNSLTQALRMREGEVTDYETNIEGFEAAILIRKTQPQGETDIITDELNKRLGEEKAMHQRCQLYLDAIMKQLEGEDIATLLVTYPDPALAPAA